AVCPVKCIFSTDDGVVLHSKDLCIGCGYCFYACPFGAPQYPKISNFGSRGKMDKCTYCAGGGGTEVPGSIEEYNKYGANRMLQGKLPLVRGDVFHQVAARRRRRNHRRDLQGARDQARLRFRLVGLADRLSRGNCGVIAPMSAITPGLAMHIRFIPLGHVRPYRPGIDKFPCCPSRTRDTGPLKRCTRE